MLSNVKLYVSKFVLKLALLHLKNFIRCKNCITLRYFSNKRSFEHSLDYSNIRRETLIMWPGILFCPKSSHTCHLNSKIFKTSKLIKKFPKIL